MTIGDRMQQWEESQESPEVVVNANFGALEHAAFAARNVQASSGLTWGYYGGRYGDNLVDNGTLTLIGEGSPTPTNYIVVNRETGALSRSISPDNWNNVAEYARAYKVPCTASGPIENLIECHLNSPYGVHGERGGIIWREKTNDHTLALVDAENGLKMNKASQILVTIPLYSTIAWPRGKGTLIWQAGDGQVVVAKADASIQLRYRKIGSPQNSASAGLDAVMALLNIEQNVWLLTGELA